jgi:hypothetical protein
LAAICLTTGAAATAATIFRKDALAWITSLTLIAVMIRMKIFGYHEFNLLRRAMLDQFASLNRTVQSLVGGSKSREQIAQGGDSLLEAWNTLIDEVRPQGIRRIDLRLASGPIEGRRHWVEPLANGRACRWSVAVSVQKRDGRACELRADGLEKPDTQREIEQLTGLLRSFGNHVFEFVEDTEVLPLMDEIRIISLKPAAKPQRKAA